MFLKVVRSSQGIEYVYVTQAYRENGRVKHKYILGLGKLKDLISSPSFKKLAKMALEDETILLDDINKDHEGDILYYGHIILKKVWNKFRLDRYFERIQRGIKNRVKFNIAQVVFYMVARHVLEPNSKLGMYNTQKRYINLPHIDLDKFYKTLDILSDTKEDLEKYLYKMNLNLFNMSVDVVFYDVTTIYFESQNQDLLKRFGFSKDGKINRVQIVLGLLINREGRPMGYDIFPGNTFEGKTLIPFLDKLKERFDIKNVVIVADRGINTKINLGDIVAHGYNYIVSTRLKGLPRNLIEELLFKKETKEERTKEKIKEREKEVEKEEIEIKKEKEKAKEETDPLYKIVTKERKLIDSHMREHVVKERFISYYSEKMAKRDKTERDKLIKKAYTLLEHPSSITSSIKRGGRKYIRIKGIGDKDSVSLTNTDNSSTNNTINNTTDISTNTVNANTTTTNTNTTTSPTTTNSSHTKISYELDIEKIREDEKFDGYYVIQTNTTLSPMSVRDVYHNLWKIEQSFRILKSQIEVRPIYHYTEKRIKGHLQVAFLSFLLLRTIELSLKERYGKEEKIKEKTKETEENTKITTTTNSTPITTEKIKEALSSYTLTKIKIKDRYYYIKNKTKPLTSKINRILKIKRLPNLIPEEEFPKSL